jgi:hypothetical protein
MRKRTCAIALMTMFLLGVAEVSAQAVPTFSNCTKMHRRFEHGVAKSRKAARRDVRDGYGRPRVSRRIYGANSQLEETTTELRARVEPRIR